MSDHLGYFVNENYSFTITKDDKGRKLGKLVNIKTGEVLAEDLYQRVMPDNIENLLNVAKIIIGAAWQDGKIDPSEKQAFYDAFKSVQFSESHKQEIEKEFLDPSSVQELVKKVKTREEKMLILEISLLLIIADKEFHPKEKEFIEYLVREFQLDSSDYALLYYILPQEVKKFIVKSKIHQTLQINNKEIKTLDKLSQKKTEKPVDHERVYNHFVDSWKNRSTRYTRTSVY